MPQDTSSVAHLDSSVSIAQFLERPVKLDQFKLISGTTGALSVPIKPVIYSQNDPQPVVRQYQLPGDVLAIGGKIQKIMNHQYFKADVRVKVVINANPFVAGRFYLTYSPYENQVDASRRQRCATRAGLTAYPGVELDIQIDNTVEIVIPYASYKEAYILTEPENYVVLSLYSLTDIMAGESTGIVEFTIYAWFENIVINVPTAKLPPIMPTANSVNARSGAYKPDQVYSAITALKTTNPDYYNYIKNLLRTKNVEIQIQAEAPGGAGPISSIASTVSNIADIASGIPIVSEIAAPVKWVSDLVGGVASIFGWSRPTVSEAVCPFQNIPGMGFTNAIGVDNSVNLSLLGAMNELIKPNDIFPSGIDEMDLEYVCRNPALKESILWNAGNTDSLSGTLAVLPVGIGPFNAYGAENTQTCLGMATHVVPGANGWPNPTGDQPGADLKPGTYTINYTTTPHVLDTAPCEYISQLYTYWRATIVFKISVVKTAFHSGRLEIAFDPGMWYYKQNAPWIPDLDKYNTLDTTNNYKYILDISNDTEVTIKIPFISERLFKSTQAANSYIFNQQDSNAYNPTLQQLQDSMIGALIIRPVNDLLAPPNVSQSVRVLVWKWAEDVVFGIPKPSIQSNLSIFTPYSATEGPCSKISQDQSQTTDQKISYFNSLISLKPCAAQNQVNKFVPETQAMMDGERQYRNRRKPREIGYDTVDAEMQINIANKANGNVEVFFQDSSMVSDGRTAAQIALGEQLVNLRSMLRCFRDIYPQYESLDKRDTTGTNYSKVFKFQKEEQNNVGFYTDYLNYLSYMYRFFRGGYRYKFIPFDTDHVQQIQTSISNDIDQFNDPFTGPTHITFPKINPFHEVTVPYYSQYRRLPISVDDDIPALEAIFSLNVNSDMSPQVRIMRAGNDDFTFGWLMGTPPIYQGLQAVAKCYDAKT